MYNKLFTKILDSSIWLEDHATRIVWMTFLAVMDEDGMCQFASAANVARRAIVTLDEARHALAILEAPDPDSSDPEGEGRRLERVPGGWIVLNSKKYREQVTREEIKRQNRERAQRFRERHKDRNGEALLFEENNAPVTQAEQEHKQEQKKPSRSKVASDDPPTKFTLFRDSFRKYFLHKNPSLTAEPWDGQEATHLSRFLKKNPALTIEQWKLILTHRARSPVSHGEQLSTWIAGAFKWIEGPTDAYGKPPNGGSNGAQKQRTDPNADRFARSIEAIGGAAARRYGGRTGADDGAGKGPVPQPNDARPDGGHVPGGVGRDGAEVRSGDIPGRVIDGVA